MKKPSSSPSPKTGKTKSKKYQMWETFYTNDLEQKEAAMERLGRSGDEDLGEYSGRELADEPGHADYIALAVSMLIKTNRPAEAEPFLVGAAEDKSDDYIAQILKGALFLATGKYDEAEEISRRTLAQNPRSSAALYAVAEVMRERKKFEDALLYYDKSLSMRPPDPVVYIQKASMLHELGKLEDQDRCYNRGLVFWPSSPHLLLAKGMLLKETHGNEHAIRYFEMALDVNPYHPETLTAMSNVLREQGMASESRKFAKDRTVARRLIRKWEGSGAQFMMPDGSLSPTAGLPKQEEKAIAEIDRFDMALELDPGCIDMLTDKWEFMSREDDVDMMAFVVPEFDMHAANGQLSSTALILVTEKKYADAVEYCDKVLAVQPRMPHILLYKGDALSGLGMHQDAVACYDRALAINPVVVDAICGKGVILAQTGQHDAAADCFEVALEINPEHDDARQWKKNLSKIM